MADLPTEIDRINALTANARNTWFALLGVLVFVGITLMGVEHIDFYGVDRATTLPLVNFDVPTRYFFVAAPILVAAIYGYFHLYLIRLWDALGNAEATVNGKPLGDLISPWLITDAALYLRVQLRDDGAATHRLLEGAVMVLNFLVAWFFGQIVLFFLWWLSMPARTFWMTAIAGLCLLAASFVGSASLAMMTSRMRRKHTGPQRNVFRTLPAMWLLVLALPALIGVSYLRTTGGVPYLATISMVDEAVVERPAGWLPYGVAKAEYKDAWCRRKSADCSGLSEASLAEFETDWTARRSGTRADMRRPYWSDRSNQKPMNWQGANLNSAYLVGAYLTEARLWGADLNFAQLEGADLQQANLQEASLTEARLERANLDRAKLQMAILGKATLDQANLNSANLTGARLNKARLDGATLNRAFLEGADFSDASLKRANLFGVTTDKQTRFMGADLRSANLNEAKLRQVTLRNAQMQRTSLTNAKLQGANLRGAQLDGANLLRTDFDGADLRAARLAGGTFDATQFEGANLSQAGILGAPGKALELTATNLKAAKANATALRHVDLSLAIWDDRTDFRNAFLDGSVVVPEAFRTRMGNPCQWVSEALSYTEFNTLSLWWAKTVGAPEYFLPEETITARAPTPNRLAELGLTDCEPGQPFGPMPATD